MNQSTGTAALVDPTDAELNAAFAVIVAGWHSIRHGYGYPNKEATGVKKLPNFTSSADLVLPWLNKRGFWTCQHSENDGGFTVSDDHLDANGTNASEADTFAKAAVLMLLRVHGVTVTFSK